MLVKIPVGAKVIKLSKFRKATPEIVSLRTKENTRTNAVNVQPRTNQTDSLSEDIEQELEDREEEECEDDGFSYFHSPEVEEVLDEYGYFVGFTHYRHPDVALVIERTTNEVMEILKFVKNGSRELDNLTHLTEKDSPHNHAIRPIRSWTVEGGTMVSLPYAGSNVMDLKDITKNLWGVACQLFEAVNFLHENKIVHLDLKPENLMIPDSYGRLTIIDFEMSVRMLAGTFCRGRVGSEGYMAPEMVNGLYYDPFKADLFSCGVVIVKLCGKSRLSIDKEILLAIANCLINPEPTKRPTSLISNKHMFSQRFRPVLASV
ncbi:hypothetical protein Clacol_008796 [Clathrus columnatus]|uniref:Protein kinase domain-containing protein n=1 Tax=Clathrus columnatus TaxID=1419009 RepID=A0AAV5ANR2_9AGAM|nr:hypothetical protein Clacol_008796 [Clathrus columnatus]